MGNNGVESISGALWKDMYFVTLCVCVYVCACVRARVHVYTLE